MCYVSGIILFSVKMFLFPLLYKGGHTFFLILRTEAKTKCLAFVGNCCIDVNLAATTDTLLGLTDSYGGLGCDKVGPLHGDSKQCFRFHNLVYQSDCKGFVGVNGLSGQDQFHGTPHSNDAA